MTPDTTRPEFVPFFEHADRGELAFPYCEACARFHWYPMKRCPHCQADAIAWRTVAGEGRLYSWTEVRHAFGAGHPPPYVVALVEFDDAPGIRFLTNVVDDADNLRIGGRVKALLPRPTGRDTVCFESVDA